MIEKIILPHKQFLSSILQDAAIVSVCSHNEAFEKMLPLLMKSSYWNKTSTCTSLLK